MFLLFMEIWTYYEIFQGKVIRSFCLKRASWWEKPFIIPLSELFQAPNDKSWDSIGSVIFMLTRYFVRKKKWYHFGTNLLKKLTVEGSNCIFAGRGNVCIDGKYEWLEALVNLVYENISNLFIMFLTMLII